MKPAPGGRTADSTKPALPARVSGAQEAAGDRPIRGTRKLGVGATTRANVLVVEDEAIVALELKDRLTTMGHSVVGVVGSGEEAIEQARRLRPDLILMDIKLQGDIDGIEAARAIHAEADIPIVYLTAFADDATLKRAKLTEPYGYILKPFQERELHVVIEVSLYRRRIHERQRFMEMASGEVASSLDQEMILRKVTALIVRSLADWCVIHLYADDGALQVAAFAHRESDMNALAHRFCATRLRPDDAREVRNVAHSGESALEADVTDKAWVATALGLNADPTRLSATSAVVVPLTARGHTFGTLALASERREGAFTDADLPFVEELGRRLASGIDNAQLYADAQRALHLRDEVLAIVSHDLRNPLSSIVLIAEQLLRSPEKITPERMKKHAQTIWNNAERMTRLIADLLDVARLDGGRLSLEFERAKATKLVADAIAMFEAAASKRSIRLASGGLPDVELLCDRERVLQVLSNLIGNALKFSPEGRSVLVRGAVSERSLVFAVSDQAGGIPRDQVPHIFDRYWQADDALHKGAGLGLYISKGLVESQGGRLWVESEPGTGSTFYFTVPLAEPSEAWAQTPR